MFTILILQFRLQIALALFCLLSDSNDQGAAGSDLSVMGILSHVLHIGVGSGS